MAKQETIKFIIKQDGTIIEEVIGTVGPNCEKLTENIEKKLGVIDYREVKPEYNEQQLTAEEDVALHNHKD